MSYKKDRRAALYFTMSDIVHRKIFRSFFSIAQNNEGLSKKFFGTNKHLFWSVSKMLKTNVGVIPFFSCHFQANCGFYIWKINKTRKRIFCFWSLWPTNEKWNEPDKRHKYFQKKVPNRNPESLLPKKDSHVCNLAPFFGIGAKVNHFLRLSHL